MTIGGAIGGIVGGIMGGVIKQTIIGIGIGIFVCAMLDIFLVFTRDTIFNVAPEAYDAGFLTKVSVAIAICLIPYLIYIAVWIIMLFFSAIMFLFTAFQNWEWILEWDPPDFLSETIGYINDLMTAFGV